MSHISQHTVAENAAMVWPLIPQAATFRTFSTKTIPDDSSRDTFLLGERVFHSYWGLGRVIGEAASPSGQIVVRWNDGIRDVSRQALRRLLPRTVIARIIERSTPNVTAWMFRKADRQGRIKPDVAGRFAGHVVHYYDPERIPALVATLSCRDSWSIDSIVMHSGHGVGRIVACAPRPEAPTRVVHFFSEPAPIVVTVRELRNLLPSSVVAARIGVHRKTFCKLAPRYGIQPDFTNEGSGRDLYDEGRIESIRQRWFRPAEATTFPVGCPVIDRVGDIAKVEYVDTSGKAHLRYLQPEGLTQDIETKFLRKLVSMRELARVEGMSRYKLQRLLTAAGVHAVLQHGKTIYFELSRAREALRERLAREGSALDLQALSQLTGVSAEVLARKVRHGCIHTTGQTTHTVDRREAERIGRLLAALQSTQAAAPSMGICRLYVRGRAGQEVASWNIQQLVTASRSLSAEQKAVLFDQVAWLCDGSGARRLRESLDVYLGSLQKRIENDRDMRCSAEILLSLLDHLPGEFSRYRNRLLLLLSGVTRHYFCGPDRLRVLASEAGTRGEEGEQQFRSRLDESFAALLDAECCASLAELAEQQSRSGKRSASAYCDDDFVPGAVIVSLSDGKPDVGIVVKVEQQAWNAMSGSWDKTIVVRFSTGERRINPYTRKRHVRQSTRTASVLLLLDSASAGALFRDLVRAKGSTELALPATSTP